MSTTDDTPAWQDADTLRRLYVTEDRSRQQVADRLGCTKSAVDDWLTRHGITKPDGPWTDRETLVELYVECELPIEQVADELHCSWSTINTWLERHGIEKRDVGRSKTYTDDELCEHLRTTDADCEYRVTQADLEAADGPSAKTYVKRYGAWTDALEAAGIDPDEPTRPPTPTRVTLDYDQGGILQSNPDAARELCRLDPPFTHAEARLSHSDFSKFHAAGIIQHAGRLDQNAWKWTPADGGVEWIRANLDSAGECPADDCHATGVRNLGDGEYTCTNDDCPETFDRATAEEVLRG